MNDILREVATYYADKLAEYGATPRGVDWNGEKSQIARFEQLCKLIDSTRTSFSINDLGCGYGALLDYLQIKHPDTKYLGIDVSREMIASAEERHSATFQARFITSFEPDQMADYGLASGIFNVRLERTDAEWFDYLRDTLNILDRTSTLGFAFNCLTSFSDEHKKRNYLYYADPCRLFNLCKTCYSPQVALLHDYDLHEFTVLVRKVQ